MFDFPFTEASIGTSLYCLLYYLVIVILNYRDGLNPYSYEISLRKERWTILFIALFIITHCYKGDFFHLMHHVHNYSSIPGAYNFGEEIYHKIGLLVGRNYFLFRTLVWGGAFALFCLTAKRMGVSVYYVAVLLISTHPIIFSYARVTAAMAVYFFGLSFFCYPLKKQWLSYIIGVLIIGFSLEFHSSAIIMVIMTIFMVLPIRGWSIILVVILFYLFSDVFKDLLIDIAIDENTNATIANKIDVYSQRQIKHGPSGIITTTLEYASFYIPVVITTINIFKEDQFDYIPCSIFRLYKVTLGLILLSILFLFMGSTYVTFVYRVLFMSMIPLTIIIVYLYQSYLMSELHYKLCVLSGITYTTFMYLYTLYLTFLGSSNI